MPNYKKIYIKPNKSLPKELMDKVVKHDSNTMEYVLERIYQGLVGELLIDDNINFPFIRKGDLVVLKESGNIRLKDFILYEYNEKYYLRRVLKIIHNEIYVAGDNEREYHITTRDKIVAKGISRIRNNKYKSFNLKQKNNLYIINKYYLQFLRFGNRVIRPESEESNEAMLQAIKANASTNRNVFVNKTIENKISDELDRELIHFINPDTLVLELEEELKAQTEGSEELEEIIEEVIEETLEAAEEQEETEEVEYVEVSEEEQQEEVEYVEEIVEETEEVEYIEVSEEEQQEEVQYVEEIVEEQEENKE